MASSSPWIYALTNCFASGPEEGLEPLSSGAGGSCHRPLSWINWTNASQASALGIARFTTSFPEVKEVRLPQMISNQGCVRGRQQSRRWGYHRWYQCKGVLEGGSNQGGDVTTDDIKSMQGCVRRRQQSRRWGYHRWYQINARVC